MADTLYGTDLIVIGGDRPIGTFLRAHPTTDTRPLVAGDLRSARFQRIMTALGSGSETALHAYYAAGERPAEG